MSNSESKVFEEEEITVIIGILIIKSKKRGILIGRSDFDIIKRVQMSNENFHRT